MPELPEVETVRRGLNKATCGQIIQGVQVLLPRTLAYPVSIEAFAQNISGCAIASWSRRGKYLLAQLERNGQPAGTLGIHLRMSGQLLWLEPDTPLQKHTRVRLWLEKELRFVDTRTFGKFWLVPPDTAPQTIITGLQKLGPEPFSEAFSSAYLQAKFKTSTRPIKNFLLDQSLVAGIGNIYADEALFKSRIHPQTPANQLSIAQIEALKDAVIEVLEAAIANGGTSFSSFRNLLGVNGNYSGIAWVYRRGGLPCRVCGTTIEKIKLAGRSSHFCPKCQMLCR